MGRNLQEMRTTNAMRDSQMFFLISLFVRSSLSLKLNSISMRPYQKSTSRPVEEALDVSFDQIPIR